MNRESQIAERIVAAEHGFKVGDILYSSWGYDQTNIDFYEVTAVGSKSIKIREIEQRVASATPGSDMVVPVPGHFKGSEMLKIVSPRGTVRLTSYSSARPWDGTPKYQTAMGYGH